MRRIVVIVAIVLAMLPGSLVAQTPVGDGPIIERGDGAARYVWQADTEVRLPDETGAASPLAPVSLTFYERDDLLWMLMEARNTGDAGMLAPGLTIEPYRGGQSFGMKNYSPERHYIPAGESGFWEWMNIFDGALLLGDWDDLKIGVAPSPYVQEAPYELVRHDAGMIVNASDRVASWVDIHMVARDTQGVYVGLCFDRVSVEIPPGQSVRAPSHLDATAPSDACAYSSARGVADLFGTGPITTDGYFLTPWFA